MLTTPIRLPGTDALRRPRLATRPASLHETPTSHNTLDTRASCKTASPRTDAHTKNTHDTGYGTRSPARLRRVRVARGTHHAPHSHDHHDHDKQKNMRKKKKRFQSLNNSELPNSQRYFSQRQDTRAQVGPLLAQNL